MVSAIYDNLLLAMEKNGLSLLKKEIVKGSMNRQKIELAKKIFMMYMLIKYRRIF